MRKGDLVVALQEEWTKLVYMMRVNKLIESMPRLQTVVDAKKVGAANINIRNTFALN